MPLCQSELSQANLVWVLRSNVGQTKGMIAVAFRTLTIDSAAEVHVRNGQLTVQRAQDANPLQIDLDDLACIVLANLDITLSTGALNMISAHAPLRLAADATTSHGRGAV